MKHELLIVAAFAFGFLPAMAGAPRVTLFTLFVPVIIGLIYFVFWRIDWPGALVPWLFVLAAAGRAIGNAWVKSDPVFDQFVWTFIVLTAVWWGLVLWPRKIRADKWKSTSKVA